MLIFTPRVELIGAERTDCSKILAMARSASADAFTTDKAIFCLLIAVSAAIAAGNAGIIKNPSLFSIVHEN